ncbi:purine-nucleoside phosphorylase [Coprothermobacter platensis]|uniref:purine-nucleoside phosphorylase n=1 Tax=Coprothermobacter platensis TaxID=108819 RepID=UPI000373E3B0|nr:purine-nucleoside phosphorylase [Coprothermobacter platensis]
MDIKDMVFETKSFLEKKIGSIDAAIIIGSGLGNLVQKMNVEEEIPYKDIPHFPKSTVKGHAGEIIVGHIGTNKVLAFNGRFHYYEGYSLSEVTYPVRVAKLLGAKLLIVTNAAGGLNPKFHVGDLMLINDHINFMGVNPLIGPNIEEWGPRFVDLYHVYSDEYMEKLRKIAVEKGVNLREGVYLAVAGPTYETHAELKMMQGFGADAVGMSTVPECIVAAHMGLPVLGVSVITDLALPYIVQEITHEMVLQAAETASNTLSELIWQLLEEVSL